MAAVAVALPVAELRVRHLNPASDTSAVEELERRCDAGGLAMDLLGDPMGRVRHFPDYAMPIHPSLQVAELGDGGPIVGMVRCGIKLMVCGRCSDRPIYAKAAYILGLRVSPSHRRMGIGMKLASSMVAWCEERGAAYAYMATERTNAASLHLFCAKLGFTAARSLALLVHPVYQHAERSLPSGAALRTLPPPTAAKAYRCHLGAVDFFPADIESVLASRHCAGTWSASYGTDDGDGGATSFAMVSVWRCNRIFRLRVAGAAWYWRALARASRWMDRALSAAVRCASFPDLFRPFGAHFLFGLVASGPRGGELLGALCRHARDLARSDGCAVVATELATGDPLLAAVPHSRCMSVMDDVWCVRTLRAGATYDATWISEPATLPVFADPRDV